MRIHRIIEADSAHHILTHLLTKQTIAQFGVTDVVVFNEYAQHIERSTLPSL